VNIGVMMVFNYKIKQTEFLTVFSKKEDKEAIQAQIAGFIY
jgi:hypothetical protein